MLKQFDTLPDGLLEARSEQLESLLGGPTLIHLRGRDPHPLFVCVLQHGNEDTGYYAVQELLRDYATRELPRSLSLFIANVAAASKGLRHLDGQPDYNRVWPGGEHSHVPESRMMAEVLAQMEQRKVFASVDIHNNTGLNPHYACVNRIDHRYLHLATLFGRTVVYFTRPRGVQSMAFAQICPAVTVECGQAGQPKGVAHAREYLDACLHLADIPIHPVVPQDIDLFHTVAIVKVPDEVSFGFNGAESNDAIHFVEDLDHLNFHELPAGTCIGSVRRDGVAGLQVWNELGKDVGSHYFEVCDGEIRTRKPFMPSMFTRDERVIRQDCLGYLMERYELV